MTQPTDQASALAALGWSAFFDDQLEPEETGLLRLRIAGVHRSRLIGDSGAGRIRLRPPPGAGTVEFAVGDWVLADPESRVAVRRLERRSLLQRRVEGGRPPQLIAANLDTLFIVTSADHDFNVARLERYLALANEAGATPVILLTKADRTPDAAFRAGQAAALQADLAVVALDATAPDAAARLAPWCGPGRTVALVGSSGVGKSTLLNALSGEGGEAAQPTGPVREADGKGRHTTTARSLHAIAGGGWAIDTPGMRSLHVGDVSFGLEILFAEIAALAPDCRFRDCSHAHEPGCAVRAAVAEGRLDPARLERWRKLAEESRGVSAPRPGPRGGRPAAGRGGVR